jgi:hypothetical protein
MCGSLPQHVNLMITVYLLNALAFGRLLGFMPFPVAVVFMLTESEVDLYMVSHKC